MASQLLPLGKHALKRNGMRFAAYWEIIELIDKCVGSRIWVVMKGDKGDKPVRVSTIHITNFMLRIQRHITWFR